MMDRVNLLVPERQQRCSTPDVDRRIEIRVTVVVTPNLHDTKHMVGPIARRSCRAKATFDPCDGQQRVERNMWLHSRYERFAFNTSDLRISNMRSMRQNDAGNDLNERHS